MYKYLDKTDIKNAILSLNLIDLKIEDNKKIKILYALSNNIENNYREFKIKKRNGLDRMLSEPSPMLKRVQRNILKNCLYEFKPSKYVTSYTPGKSLKDNSCVHVGKKTILKLDIKDFFSNIGFGLVYTKVFGNMPKEIGVLLTTLVTYYGVLPQGAPTSAYISNLVLRDFDEEIGLWAKNKNIDYTRYSDDLTFSGDFDPKEVILFVRKKLRYYGLELNEDKIHVVDKCKSQLVTGVVVNEKVQVNRKYRNKIRNEMYYIEKYGITNHLNKLGLLVDEKKYLQSLYGRICFVLSIDESNRDFKEYKRIILNLLRRY